MNDTIPAATRRMVTRFLLDYNPFYLLSALCMLAGLFALNGWLQFSPLPLLNVIQLILILNVYEFMLIFLGLFLARRALWHDAITLLVLEAFFLVDGGFLNSEALSMDLEIGLMINSALLILAIFKLAIIFRGLGLQLADPRFWLIVLQLILLPAMEWFFKATFDFHGGHIRPFAVYAVWWVVGLIPIAYLLLMPSAPRARGLIGAFIALPMISILAHLGTTNWVYHVPWAYENLSPPLLGLAIAVGAYEHRVRSLTLRMRLQLLIPLLAIVFSLVETRELIFLNTPIIVSPLRLTLLAAACVYLHGLFLHRHIYFGAGAMTCLGAAAVGATPELMLQNLVHVGDRSAKSAWDSLPKTSFGWGAVSVFCSFVLLGIGLLLSLLKLAERKTEPVEEST